MTEDCDDMISLKDLGLEILQVPEELRENLLWAGSTYDVIDEVTGKRDKAPRNIYTGERISVTSDDGWVTFEEVMNSQYPAVGFKLTSRDPYVVIDLDKVHDAEQNERARKIMSSFDSYTEVSKSGNGVHIILKGPAMKGRRRGNVEIYSQERYIICTGKTIRNKPIIEGGELLDKLIATLTEFENVETLPIIDSEDEPMTDDAIIKKMIAADNGETIIRLFRMKPGPKDDWSRLDAQLAQHIAFYTRNHDQAIRLFRRSALYRGDGQKAGYEDREKYEQEYLLRLTFGRAWQLEKQRRQEEAEASAKVIEMMKANSIIRAEESPESIERKKLKESLPRLTMETYDEFLEAKILPDYTKPTGIVGEILEYIYSTSPRPLVEVALAGALAMVSGIAGRHYNINGSGLGLYIVLLAPTGRGKESASTGISQLMNSVSQHIPAAEMFRGPSHLASGQALNRIMAGTGDDRDIPSKFMIMSEFSHTMAIITSRDASSSESKTRQVLLDLFSKNGWGREVRETAYADKQNNINHMKSPNLCLLGDTTPENFFKEVKPFMISEGFLPRFMLIEYDGKRGPANYNRDKTPSEELVTRLVTLVNQVLMLRDSDMCINIPFATPQAEVAMQAFDLYCDDRVNEDGSDAEMWNRAGLKALRLAGIFAVSDNLFSPTVTEDHVALAVEYVLRDMLSYGFRLNFGKFGDADEQRELEIIKKAYLYFEGKVDYDALAIPSEYTDLGVMPMMYISDAVNTELLFNNTSKGSRNEIANTLDVLVRKGVFKLIDMREVRKTDKRVFYKDEYVYSRGNMYESSLTKLGLRSSKSENNRIEALARELHRSYIPPEDGENHDGPEDDQR